MTIDLFIALMTFAFVTSISPGPNNTMILASGVNFGVRRSIPHMLGIGCGFTLMVVIVGLGLGKIFSAYPVAYTGMKIVGGAYMLWLAWKIATAKLAEEGEAAAGAPLTFVQAALFQWVNPKGWVMSITALSAYTVASDYRLGLITVVLTFALLSFSSCTTWALFGMGLRHVLNDPRYFRGINIALAALLVASLVPMLWH